MSDARNNNNNGEVQTQGFFLDKKISVAFIFYLLTQTFMGGWWAATTSSDLSNMKDNMGKIAAEIYTKKEADLQFAILDRRVESLEQWQERINEKFYLTPKGGK